MDSMHPTPHPPSDTESVNQQLLRLVMDTLPEHIFWKDRHSVFLGCNQKLADVAGVATPADIVGKTDYDLAWKREEADFFRQCDRRVMESGIPELGIIEPQQQADGKQAWLETNKIPLRDAAGNVIGIMGSFQDITPRYEAELALKQLNEALEERVSARTAELQQTLEALQTAQTQMIQAEKMSSLGQLVAGVAHEINNPINFIYGNLPHVQNYAQQLVEGIQYYQQADRTPCNDPATPASPIDLDFIQTDLPKILRSMEAGTNRVREIVLSLRNFSRLDEAESKTVDLHEGIDSTILMLQHRCIVTPDRPPIQILKHYGDLPRVSCYPGHLNQVFLNLLSNAIDAIETTAEKNVGKTETESVSPTRLPTITIRSHMLGNTHVKITIGDNGCGIPTEHQSRLFDPFFTTKPIGQGTGMGLSIAYQIISNHQGRLYCNSTVGQGTQFVIELPIHASPI
jgi:two-component system, NtrC family, sensor kinase